MVGGNLLLRVDGLEIHCLLLVQRPKLLIQRGLSALEFYHAKKLVLANPKKSTNTYRYRRLCYPLTFED